MASNVASNVASAIVPADIKELDPAQVYTHPQRCDSGACICCLVLARNGIASTKGKPSYLFFVSA